MKEKIFKFLKIMKAELEDTVDDVSAFIEIWDTRYTEKAITEYVYKENICVLKEELTALAMALNDLEKMDPNAFENMIDAGNALLEMIDAEAYENDMPQAIRNLVEKKIKKVIDFIQV